MEEMVSLLKYCFVVVVDVVVDARQLCSALMLMFTVVVVLTTVRRD